MPRIRIAAYNVLAQCLAKSSYFPYAAGSDTLKQKARFPRIFAVLAACNADILCLSEVDCIADYATWLTAHDFAFEYERRRGKAYGSLIAWKTARFSLVRRAACDLNDVVAAVSAPPGAAASSAASADGDSTTSWAQQWLAARGHSARAVDAEEYKRDCVALFVALDVIDAAAGGTRIVVAATHLYWDPAFPHVRAAQAAVLHGCLRDFRVACAGEEDAPCFLAGDFNALPLTEAYNILLCTPLAHGNAAGVEEWDISAAAAVAGPAATPRVLQPAWLTRVRAFMYAAAAMESVGATTPPASSVGALRSAYATAVAAGMHVGALLAADTTADAGATSSIRHGEPAFTTMTDSFNGALDHIFYAPAESVRVCGVLPLPNEADVRVHTAMPSCVHPSDHAPIAADFEWCARGDEVAASAAGGR